MIILLAAAASQAFHKFAPAVSTPILWSIIAVAILVNLVIKGRIVLAEQAEQRGTEAAHPATAVNQVAFQRPRLSLKSIRRLLPVDAATTGALALVVGALHFIPEQ